MLKFPLMILAAGLLAVACSPQPQPTAEVAAIAAADADAKMRALADDFVAGQLQNDPSQAYFIGLEAPRHDTWPQRSESALQAWRGREDAWLSQLQTIPLDSLKLNSLRLAHQQLREHLQAQQQLRVCRRELWSISHMDGWHLVMAEIAERQPVDTAERRAQALQRFSAVPDFIEQEIDNLRRGLARGYSVPQPVVKRVVVQVEGMLVEDVADSPLYAPATHAGDAEFSTAFAEVVQSRAQPALRRYLDFLRDDYLPQARTSLGVSALPEGAACYQALLRESTTLQRSPEQVVALGEQTVAANLERVRALGKTLFDSDDIAEIVARGEAAADNHFNSEQELIEFSRATVARAETLMPPLFATLPQQAVRVDPPPEHERGSGRSSHYDPQPDTEKHATYRINIDTWQATTRGSAEIVAAHEAWPGHHLQFALDRELNQEAHPLSRMIYNAAYAEGWGRYAESLAEEVGLYQTPYALITRRIWPARGMVIDPGIHVGDWTRQQARDYLLATGRFDERQAEAQIDRIAAIPAQMTSYDSGALEIVALRAEAEAALGEHFDIRQFHQQILQRGVMPLGALREQVRDWIAVERARH